MFVRRLACSLLVLLPAALGRTDEFELNGHRFTLPPGFTLELAAGPPLVERPICADWDEQGRLYVAESSGSNDKVAEQLAQKPHRILRLEDTDRDGRFDQRTIFADQLMFPEGTLWYDGSLYVAAPPSIWRLTDRDGDGVAEEREEWFQGKTLTGCANDLHGPYLGRDGRIYWCKGAFAEQTYDLPGHPAWTTRASHIFRCRPDKSDFEPVMTGGMDNPVEVAFTSGGERIFSTTFLQHPGGGKRDGLIHALYGGVYGKVHQVIEGHPRTGDILPPLVHLGPAAPCGLMCYESAGWGAVYQGNLFATLFNMHKVTRHQLLPQGASFTTRDEDFLVSDQLDFHPTDVLEDADGSLVVIDTGGWYKLCCPTSQLWKPDVFGAIYRVRRSGSAAVSDPWGQEIAWERLTVPEACARLGDERPAVQRRALAWLAKSGSAAVGDLAATRSSPSLLKRRNAVWALARIDDPAARSATRAYLSDTDPTVRLAALHVISLWRDREALPDLLAILKRPAAAEQRVAAEGLGRIQAAAAVPSLLEAAEHHGDRQLEHGLIYALWEIADPAATARGLEHPNSRVRRAAAIALDQMPEAQLDPRQLIPWLVSSDPVLLETATWLASRHADWGGPLSEFLEQRLLSPGLSADQVTELEQLLTRLAPDAAIQALLARAASNERAALPARLAALRAMSRAGLKEPPAAWMEAWVAILQQAQPELCAAAVAAARAFASSKSRSAPLALALQRLAGIDGLPLETRLQALAARPAGEPLAAESFTLALAALQPDQSLSHRAVGTEVLSRAALTKEQFQALADRLPAVGPLELPPLVAAFERSSDPAVGERLASALARAPALASLRSESLRPLLNRYGEGLASATEELCRQLDMTLAEQRARLAELVPQVAAGDIRRGQAIFHSQKAACFACHAMGYLGGNIGPDLTRIGQIRNERDLLESILYPSASLVRSYESIQIETVNGKLLNGILKQDLPDAVVLVTGTREEVRVPREEIESLQPSTVSIMPAGLDQQLSVQDLADLVAFLRNAK